MGKIKEMFEIVRESGATFSVRFDSENGVFLFTMGNVVHEVYPDEIGPSVPYILEKMLADLKRF